MKHLKGLQHPDARTTDILSQYAPEDAEEMERIFQRAEQKYRMQTAAPAVPVPERVPEYKPRRLFAAAVSLAVCAVIGVGGWGLWKLSRHTPPVPPLAPEQSVDSETPQAPFLAAINTAIANGYDLQFYGNPDEEGYPILNDAQTKSPSIMP